MSYPDYVKIPNNAIEVPAGWIVLRPNDDIVQVPSMDINEHLYAKMERTPSSFKIALEKCVRLTFDENNDVDVNPWNVNDASEFLRYQCPECQFQSRTLDKFSGHAVLNHIKASKLFRNVKPNKKVANDAWEELNQEFSCLERFEKDELELNIEIAINDKSE